MQQIGPTHCLKCHYNTDDLVNHLCNSAFTSACIPECGDFYKSKDLTARIEGVLEKYSLYYDSETVTVQPKFLAPKIAALFSEETAHDTLDGYCCACDYDQAEFEHKLTKFKTRILERGPKDLEPENNVAKFHNALNAEWRKVIQDL